MITFVLSSAASILAVFSAKDIARRSPVGLIRKTPGFGPRSALKLLQDEDREYGYVIERGNKFVGIVSIDSLKSALSENQGLDAALIDSPQAVEAQTPLSDLLSHVGGRRAPSRWWMKDTSISALFQNACCYRL